MGRHNPPGRTVGLFSAQVPRELFYALGCTPVRVFPSAGKPTAAEAFLPRNFCSLNRLILASFLENGGANLDAVIFADEDDATRRLYDVWRACVPVPVWGFVEVPRVATPLAASRYADILIRTAAELEGRTGRSLSAGSLHQAIAAYNRQRSSLADLKYQWLAGRVDTTTYRRLRRMALTQDPLAANGRLSETLEEAEAGEEARPVPPPSRRLLLLGELAVPAGLVRLIEAHGARVVAEDSDLDERDLARPVTADANTVEELLIALANAYLSKPPGPRMRDLPRRLAYLSQLVAERGVQAAICAYSKFCDLYLAEFPILKTHLEGLGVPVLLLELEDDGVSGQHRTRVEAFLEMLDGG
jgi:benzoyl-CoA reductase/2-hydroxyglutaryl-CoA dehydratase subunit BcrC/BadD/HgdB